YSIEHDEKWLGLVPESNYIYAPLIDGWYDVEILKNELPKHYDLLLVDGPVGENRINIINHYEMFKQNIPIIIDDTNRENDRNMSIFLSEKLDKKITLSVGCEDKIFTILF
ncbi:MAG: hypothetical protein ACK55Z_31100, partial [bacterium]